MSEIMRRARELLAEMDDDVMAELRSDIAERGRRLAAGEVHEWETQTPKQTQTKTREIIRRKVYTPPETQQAATMMDAATQKQWDEFVQAHIKIALDQQLEIIAETLALERKEFERSLGELRAELNLLTGLQRGQIAELKGGRDAA